MKVVTGRRIIAVSMMLVILCAVVAIVVLPPRYDPIPFPDGKTFAFSICDDTDMASLDNVKPVYDYLYELGLRTTKTVWVLPTNEPEAWANRGASLSDSD